MDSIRRLLDSSEGTLGRFRRDSTLLVAIALSLYGAMKGAGAIVTAVVTLGHAMGLQVTAEGVETQGQREVLRRYRRRVLGPQRAVADPLLGKHAVPGGFVVKIKLAVLVERVV